MFFLAAALGIVPALSGYPGHRRLQIVGIIIVAASLAGGIRQMQIQKIVHDNAMEIIRKNDELNKSHGNPPESNQSN
jgi:hypothetical protein